MVLKTRSHQKIKGREPWVMENKWGELKHCPTLTLQREHPVCTTWRGKPGGAPQSPRTEDMFLGVWGNQDSWISQTGVWGWRGGGRERGLLSDGTLELGRGSPLIPQLSIPRPVCVSELPEARKGTSQKSEGAVTPRAHRPAWKRARLREPEGRLSGFMRRPSSFLLEND